MTEFIKELCGVGVLFFCCCCYWYYENALISIDFVGSDTHNDIEPLYAPDFSRRVSEVLGKRTMILSCKSRTHFICKT